MGISQRMNLIARQEFELAYNEVLVQHIKHNAKVILP